MRNRRRHLVGCLGGAAPGSRRRRLRPGGAVASRPRASPPTRRSRSSPRNRGRPKPRAADRHRRPQPQRLLGARGAELARLHAALLRPLGRRGPRRPRPRRPQRRRHPRLRRAGAAGRRTRPPGREREARLARAAQRRPPGRPARQDRRLPLPDRRRTVRLRGARPRPGDQGSTGSRAGCTATWSSTTTTAPSSSPAPSRSRTCEVTFAHEYNHILQFGYDAYQDPWFAEASATWMEDQVYNGINDYLRYVRRWVKPLRHAADRQLDQGVRLRRLEPVAGAALRPGDRPQGLGRGDPRQARRLLGRRLRTGDLRSTGPSDFEPRLRPLRRRGGRVAHRQGLPREPPLPGRPAPGPPAARRHAR